MIPIQKVRYKTCIVAFLDILGFKKIVEDVSQCKNIYSVLNLPYQLCLKEIQKSFKISGVMMTSISDSIVISIPRSMKNAMNKMINIVSSISGVLLHMHGLLLRGAITVGELYHDEQVVFGPALVKAYLLESQSAGYPRIIIEPDDLDLSVQSCTAISASTNKEGFRTDGDGWLYLRIFRWTNNMQKTSCLAHIRSQHADSEHVMEKYAWMERELLREIKEGTQN